jgi:hypothetical protein
MKTIAEIGQLERRRSMVASVKVIHAANDGVFDVPGRTPVRVIRASLVDAFNIPAIALALVNGERCRETHGLLDADTLEFVVANGRKGTDLRTPDDVLADLDRLRDRRIAKTVSEKVYHDEQDRLWEELREIDRLDRQSREEEARIERLDRQSREEEARIERLDSQRTSG